MVGVWGGDKCNTQSENYHVVTYRSLLNRNWFFHISPEYGRSVTCFIYNTELITAVLIFKPRPKVTLEEKKQQIKTPALKSVRGLKSKCAQTFSSKMQKNS